MLSEEIKTLQGFFLDNGYPGHLGQRIVQVAQPTDSTEDRHESTTDPAHFVNLWLPWIGRYRTEFAGKIRKGMRTSFVG